MEYKEGQLIEFDIYGTTVIGNFIKIENDEIFIKVTKDFIKENIATEQSIHKSHPHCIVNQS
jgi:hypothetical protein